AAGRAPRRARAARQSARCGDRSAFSRIRSGVRRRLPRAPAASHRARRRLRAEPDIVVVRGGPWDYVRAHPSVPVLVAEIAETPLVLDRGHKSALYPRAGIADYWIVNLREAVVEVYRQPAPSDAAPPGWEYRSKQRLAVGATISPLAAPSQSILIA